MGAILYLRSPDGTAPETATGNHLLQLVAGAECRFITPAQWDDRDAIMADAAASHGNAWVIPEGASDALGALGFVAAMRGDRAADGELSASNVPSSGMPHRAPGQPPAWCGVQPNSVSTSRLWVRRSATRPTWWNSESVSSSMTPTPSSVECRSAVPWRIVDDYIGLGYGLSTPDELAAQSHATRLTGLLFDPAYTGKALYGLRQEIRSGRIGRDRNVIFWHTGGGFAVFAHPEIVDGVE